MAKVIENTKGFYVIEIPLVELNEAFGGLGICDYCATASQMGYYIAVLNSWYCPQCYKKWLARAVRYPQDMDIEKRNFDIVKEKLSL